ncbi:MAG: NAD(P)/FAD-dependent oxidoreductase [Gammaproteobacteria bacterium]|nr:NAD(P)/FAD-dependent oxidoreductase [Gammaproteobacteria bacterium]
MHAVAESPEKIFDPLQDNSCWADPIIIVGTGPVGIRCAEELLSRGYRGRIVMFGDEPWQPYNRIKLSSLLAGDIGIDAIANNVRFMAGERLVQHLCCAVKAVLPDDKTVLDASGKLHRYEKLILAVGSRAHIPDVSGVDKAGVYTFRDLRDTEHLAARTARCRQVVVVGGGLLGLEAARALQRGHAEVTLVQQAPRLLNRQLDDNGADLLQQRVEALGIKVRTGSGLGAILGGSRVTAVRLRDSTELPCDTVLLATGIRPNVELARRAWIKVRHGIQVDDQLRTSAADVYAIGECAEHRGQTYGLVAPGYEQAAVLADVLAGGSARYLGSLNLAQLKVVGEPVFSLGEAADPPNELRQRAITFRDSQQAVYRKVVLQKGCFVAALAVGELPESRRLQEAVQSQRRLHWWEELRFRRTGRFWPEGSEADVSRWPAGATVCQCMGVTRGRLSDALEQGCLSAEALSARTGAGTVCGSCKPLLRDLAGTAGPATVEPGALPLWLSGALGTLFFLAWLLLPAARVPDSVQTGFSLASVWNDGLAKQISGFTLLGLTLIGLLMSLRKRLPGIQWGTFSAWRLLHVLLGAFCLLLLALHTGLNLGANLNLFLALNFLALALLGAVTSLAIGQEHSLRPATSRRLRTLLVWSHILAAWPFPALLGFHVLTVYYF